MSVIYDKLWMILAEKGMNRTQLKNETGISTNAMALMGKNEPVSIDALARICCLFDCKLDDIIEIQDDYDKTPLPDICFDKFENKQQYTTLGFASINDFPKPVFRFSVEKALLLYYESGKLNFDACKELVDELEKHGITISFPKKSVPNIDLIPREFEKELLLNRDDYFDIEHQQVFNYFSWVLSNSLDRLEMDPPSSRPQKQCVFESGYIQTLQDNRITFVGAKEEHRSLGDDYSLGVLFDLLGVEDIYFFENRQSDLAEYMKVLLRLCDNEHEWPCEKEHTPQSLFWRLKYQYGLDAYGIIKWLNLPEYDSFVWAVDYMSQIRTRFHMYAWQKIYREIKEHLSLKSFQEFYCLKDYYSEEWKGRVYSDVFCALDDNKSLEEALAVDYSDDVIRRVVSASNRWRTIPQVSIDNLALDWKSYSALEHAKLYSLEDLWNVHGREKSLGDHESSGLNDVPGLGEEQVNTILSTMANYPLTTIEDERIVEMVDYAENAILGESELDIACCAMPKVTFNTLLKLGYRRMDKVLKDFSTKTLHGLLEGLLENNQISHEDGSLLLKTLQEYTTGKFAVVHLSVCDFWQSTLSNNKDISLEQIRNAYMCGDALPCNPIESEKHITGLFPPEQIEFNILHQTRLREMQWIPWPKELFTSTICKTLFSDENVSIRKAYFSKLKTKCYLMVNVNVEKNDEQLLFEIDSYPATCIDIIDAEVMINIFDAIQFNAELFATTQSWDGSVKASFYWHQIKFCDYFSDYTENEKEVSFLRGYEPTVLETQDDESRTISRESIAMPIEDLDLSIRSIRCLKRANCNTVNDILQMSSDELIRVRNLGLKSAKEIVLALFMRGFDVSDDLMGLLSESV